jgi:hypothetical protein
MALVLPRNIREQLWPDPWGTDTCQKGVGHCRFRPVVLAQKHTQAQPTFEKYIANLDKNLKTELDTPENASLGEVRKEHGFH